jgi:hypothetical protein
MYLFPIKPTFKNEIGTIPAPLTISCQAGMRRSHFLPGFALLFLLLGGIFPASCVNNKWPTSPFFHVPTLTATPTSLCNPLICTPTITPTPTVTGTPTNTPVPSMTPTYTPTVTRTPTHTYIIYVDPAHDGNGYWAPIKRGTYHRFPSPRNFRDDGALFQIRPFRAEDLSHPPRLRTKACTPRCHF